MTQTQVVARLEQTVAKFTDLNDGASDALCFEMERRHAIRVSSYERLFGSSHPLPVGLTVFQSLREAVCWGKTFRQVREVRYSHPPLYLEAREADALRKQKASGSAVPSKPTGKIDAAPLKRSALMKKGKMALYVQAQQAEVVGEDMAPGDYTKEQLVHRLLNPQDYKR